MTYQPSPTIGQPGQISIDEAASYSALLHERQYVMDEFQSGWQGARIAWHKDKHLDFEERAYGAEIRFCKENSVPKEYIERLEMLLKVEKNRLFGGDENG